MSGPRAPACHEEHTRCSGRFRLIDIMSRNVFRLLREFWREVQGFGAPVGAMHRCNGASYVTLQTQHVVDRLLQELERMERETLQLRQQIEQVSPSPPLPLATCPSVHTPGAGV